MESSVADEREVAVEAGASLDVAVELDANMRVAWRFTTESFDIGFSAAFLPRRFRAGASESKEDGAPTEAPEPRVEREVVPYARENAHELPQFGSFESGSTGGRLTLSFDNTYSHFRYGSSWASAVVVAKE